jgi:hypothetical protein
MKYAFASLILLLALALAFASCGRDDDRRTASDADVDGDSDADTDSSTEYDGPAIPETCEQAAQAATTVGCLFYAVDLDSHDMVEDQQYAIAVSNVHQASVATVSMSKGNPSGEWDPPQTVEVQPMSLHSFNTMPDYHQDGSGVMLKGSYKVESDIPIIVYQFNPVDGASSYLSDASMLIPVTSLSLTYDVVGWKQNQGDGDMRAYFTVVATQDNTSITVEPSVAPLAGGVVPGTQTGFSVDLDEGDVLEVQTANVGDSLTGTRITADEGHPIIVFSGQECAFIPETIYACDHLEEQIPGMRFWGKDFAASRMPVRSAAATAEDVLWQVYASEDETEVSFDATAGVTGLPASPSYLDQGQVLEFYAGGTSTEPGDFMVHSNKPIGLMQYMIGSENPNCGSIGDPAMVYVSPTEQFLPRYVVLVPGTWINDALIITRHQGSAVVLDDETLPDDVFTPVASSGFEVARVPVPDGIHTLETGSESGLGVIVVGWDEWDSYAYTGGMGMGEINPGVE